MSQLASLHVENGAVMGERNNIKIPLTYGKPDAEYNAVRQHILLVDYSHFAIVEVRGEDGYDLLNSIVAGDLSSVRDEQAIYTVILDQDGEILIDLYLLCDEERFILLTEWMTGEELTKLLESELAKTEFEDIEIRCLNDQYGILHYEGPYSWELMSEFYGMDVIGLPFMEFTTIDDVLLFRSGKHGEFSFKVIVEHDKMVELWERSLAAGKKFDMEVGGLDYQKLVRVENPCWVPDTYAKYTRCPIEMQMQWTINYDKGEFIGLEALTDKLERGITQRAIGFSIASEIPLNIAEGDKVYYQDEEIGVVMVSDYSHVNKCQIGRLMLKSEFAYADIINFYTVDGKDGKLTMNTAPIPFARNYSFIVNPAEHSYIDPNRPKNLLEQLEKLRKEEEEKKAAEAAKKAKEEAMKAAEAEDAEIVEIEEIDRQEKTGT